eukprot:COSAG04_NODE_384_length_15390_cov_64.570158_7_plen_240_part_00
MQGLGLRDLHLHAVHVHRGDLLEARLGALERGGRSERGRVRAVAALLAPGEEVHRLHLVALGVRVVAQQPARSRAGRCVCACEQRAAAGGGGASVGAHRLEWLAVMSSSSLSHWYVTVRFSSHTKRSTSSSSAAFAIAGQAVALTAATFARLRRLGAWRDAVAVALRGKAAGVAAGKRRSWRRAERRHRESAAVTQLLSLCFFKRAALHQRSICIDDRIRIGLHERSLEADVTSRRGPS